MPNQGLKRLTLRPHPPISTLSMRVLTVSEKPASIPVILGRMFPTVVTFRSARIAGMQSLVRKFCVLSYYM